MANEQAKYLNSRRRHKDEAAVRKQLKIAKASGNTKYIAEPHRLAKHHAMDCGNPECFLCGNPRKTHKDRLTQQEKRLFQDLEKITDKHSNGVPVNEDDILQEGGTQVRPSE
jgi:hypothetical protein